MSPCPPRTGKSAASPVWGAPRMSRAAPAARPRRTAGGGFARRRGPRRARASSRRRASGRASPRRAAARRLARPKAPSVLRSSRRTMKRTARSTDSETTAMRLRASVDEQQAARAQLVEQAVDLAEALAQAALDGRLGRGFAQAREEARRAGRDELGVGREDRRRARGVQRRGRDVGGHDRDEEARGRSRRTVRRSSQRRRLGAEIEQHDGRILVGPGGAGVHERDAHGADALGGELGAHLAREVDVLRDDSGTPTTARRPRRR